MIIPAIQLWESLRLLGLEVNNPLLDQQYFCPSPEWLKDFAGWLSDVPYVDDGFDCENKAMRAVAHADAALLMRDAEGVGHTFGIVAVTTKASMPLCGQTLGPDRGHALNLVLCSDETLYLFDPQNRRYEKASVPLSHPGCNRKLVLWM